MKDEYKANQWLYTLEKELIRVVDERIAQEPELRMQVGHKFHAVAIMFYLSVGGEYEAYLLWEKSAETLDELNDYFPEIEEYKDLRKRVFAEIVKILSTNDDQKAIEWKKKLDDISK
jgi:hypothetical protein